MRLEVVHELSNLNIRQIVEDIRVPCSLSSLALVLGRNRLWRFRQCFQLCEDGGAEKGIWLWFLWYLVRLLPYSPRLS